MTLVARLAALEKARPRIGRPLLCWTVSDAEIAEVAAQWGQPFEATARRLDAVHAASERTRSFWRVPRGLWYQGPLYTALAAHLMADEDGALSFEDAEELCRAVAAHVGPARWREGYPYR